MINTYKIALGGGCHWCTEAVYQSLKGVVKVEQGYVSSIAGASSFSEAVIVHYNPGEISMKTLIEVHLYTHKSSSGHSLRDRYRSAVYVFSEEQKREAKQIIKLFQGNFNDKLITQVLMFAEFKPSREQITNYFYKNPAKPFCQRFIEPKLEVLIQRFSNYTNNQLDARVSKRKSQTI